MAGLSRLLVVLAFAALFTLVGVASSRAGAVTVRGAEMSRFGRIELVFERPVKVTARVSNGILVVGFGEASALRTERLGVEMPAYVSNVRRDPDGTGFRVALNAAYRPNVLEAGERVFIDLLPETWTGLPPSLPPDVVAELVRRAQVAEAKSQAEAMRRKVEIPKPVAMHVAVLPTLTRIVFEPPGVVPIDFKAEGEAVELRFDGPLTLDASDARARLLGQVRGLTGETLGGTLVVRLQLEPGRTARGFREDETYVVDIERPPTKAPEPAPDAAKAASEKPAPEKPAPRPSFSANAAREGAREPAAPVREAPKPAPEKPAPRPPAPEPVRAGATLGREGLQIVFPFKGRTAAAAFERAGLVTLAFHTPDSVAVPGLPPGAERIAGAAEVAREGSFAVVRMPLASPATVRLSPRGEAWVLDLGADAQSPAEPLSAARAVDENGRTALVIPVRDASGVHWLEGGGERIALVTAFPPARGTAKPQRFTEVELLPTAHGFAVRAIADDVTVRTDLDGVTIARGSGLTLTLPGMEARGEGANAPPADPAIARGPWDADREGPVRERQRALLDRVARASRSDRTGARLDLARFLLANDLNHEAHGILAYAVVDEPTLADDRIVALLQAAAAVQIRRTDEARRLLGRPDLGDDPEGILWRAVMDARAERWGPALTGFRRAAGALDAYPDALQARMRLLAARAGIEMRDMTYAENELRAVRGLDPGVVPRDEPELLRARLDEALGRKEVAISLFRRIAETAERPLAAEATLRWLDLATAEGVMDAAEAVARYETLAVAWRGDGIEIAALGRLGRLYAEAGRWREAFVTARQANRIYPDHEITRGLHEETARLFDELFLSGRGETLTRLEALGLFFDFKDFLPIGRRGDEIVRRLADRLVELDLLAQAGDLLQHQVDNRLNGAARATVAARLATIRLMDGKPAAALAALHASRLPELPRTVKRARMLLEARALSDLSRTDLALEVLADERGPEVDRLRADVLWTGRRWREVGEAHEALAGTRWQGPEPLAERDRTDVMRAAIAYALGDEPIALDRLRAKFAPKMADSSDAAGFAVLTRPGAAPTRAFRDIARRVTSADTLADFLAEYRRRYPDAAATERPRRAPQPEPAPQVQGAAPEPGRRG
ncbi:tetratricopeptide repeat protein [Salinarimonas soli]|uniref:tetratricopeptide repeat protein n=1 Tax=Salinarimonas soli TaxID=1638099 RepID=UPI001661939B|nr:tetratricopeptide repeat protein [Salinarimonas soli]